MEPRPSLLGLKKSFGFGDRLGLAGPGHIAAAKAHDFAPIFAQQSIREMDRTQRTASEVMQAATDALAAAKWHLPWGADADHLKSPADLQRCASAGFTFFTIDPSDLVNNAADTLAEADLRSEAQQQTRDGIYSGESPESLYAGKTFEVDGAPAITFESEPLLRAACKYGRAIQRTEEMAGHIARICSAQPYEIEVSVDETDSPTSPLEHLFFALELRRRGVVVVSLAPRFIGDFEKGIDYKGDLAAFEQSLNAHVAISRAYGPYKISVHSGSDKFSIYPIIGRLCGDLLHVKTAGTSYLEALRAVCRTDPELFVEIVAFSAERFPTDRATYHISVTDDWARANAQPAPQPAPLEETYLNQNEGRQMLHVTFGSVLTQGQRPGGQPFRDAILELLRANPALHQEVLANHLGRHLTQLNAG